MTGSLYQEMKEKEEKERRVNQGSDIFFLTAEEIGGKYLNCQIHCTHRLTNVLVKHICNLHPGII